MRKRTAVLLVLMAVLTVVLTGTAYANGWRWGAYKGLQVVKVYVNGSEVSLDVPAVVMDGRTLVPVRFVSEALGARVDWYDAGQEVFVYAEEKTATGNTDRYDQGWSDGYQIGYEDGRRSVGDFDTGYNVGYRDGYEAGLRTTSSTSSPTGFLDAYPPRERYHNAAGIKIIAGADDAPQFSFVIAEAIDLLARYDPSSYKMVMDGIREIELVPKPDQPRVAEIRVFNKKVTYFNWENLGLITPSYGDNKDKIVYYHRISDAIYVLVHEAGHVRSFGREIPPGYTNEERLLDDWAAQANNKVQEGLRRDGLLDFYSR